jgi:hypothetical protein
MKHDIESQLSTLKPTGQSDLARRILAISHRKRQRRRDCFVGLTGLLTGIAATVLVMFSLAENGRHSRESGNLDARYEYNSLDPCLRRGDEEIDLDVWIARYEKLLRHRRETTTYSVMTTPTVMPNGMSPLEYRNMLLQEIAEPQS